MVRFSAFILSILCLSSRGLTTEANAGDWFDEATREFEEQRLQQLQTVRNESAIKAFSTDGCSGFQSQSWAALADLFPGFGKQFGDKPPWENCCFIHDKAYWQGEVEDGYTKRLKADRALRQCIVDTGAGLAPGLSLEYKVSELRVRQAFSITAESMYKAVRLGGLPCSLLSWRWGYGWDSCAFAATDHPRTDGER